MLVPEAADSVQIAFLPPMSGLAATETRLDPGAINVRIGEGRTAEVLRNLCYHIHEDHPERWDVLAEQIKRLFGSELDPPRYVPERGEIAMTYHESGARLDLSSTGRGLQQTAAGRDSGSQIVAATHLEGSTDLAILRTFAERLGHREASAALERPFVHYVGDQPRSVQRHYHAMREALPHLKGVALSDRLTGDEPDLTPVECLMWERREIENYLCLPATLEAYAIKSAASAAPGPLFAESSAARRRDAMREAIDEIGSALEKLGRGSPWGRDTTVSRDHLRARSPIVRRDVILGCRVDGTWDRRRSRDDPGRDSGRGRTS